MIPIETLLKTIESFNNKFEEIKNKCADAKEPIREHTEYYKMAQAWHKLQEVVEYQLLPFTNDR